MAPPPIRGIAETVLYADDLPASAAFFRDVMRLEPVFESDGLVVFACGTAQNLLVFDRAVAAADKRLPGGTIPGHRSEGAAHMAFHVSHADYPRWRDHFAAEGVDVVSEVGFEGGGRSLYFRDPAGNVLELATPGHWRSF